MRTVCQFRTGSNSLRLHNSAHDPNGELFMKTIIIHNGNIQ